MTVLTNLQNQPLPPERARLPALPAPELSVEFIARVKEILETMQGQRGTGWDRVVTLRDLQTMGVAGFGGGGFGSETGGFQAISQNAPIAEQVQQLDEMIRQTLAYQSLVSKIGSPESYVGLPDEVRAQLEPMLLDIARERRADIREMDMKIQEESRSLAYRMTEITASLGQAAAGVRSFSAAYADDILAMSVRIDEISAQLGSAGSTSVEERLTALASATDGLKAQYSLKLQTNPVNGQPPVIAGIALAAESPIAGPGTSSLIFMAEKIGFLTGNGSVAPFTVVGNQVKATNLIAESLKVIMADGTVVLDAGKTLEQQTRVSPNLAPAVRAWKYSTNGAAGLGGSANTANGEYINLPAFAGFVSLETDIVVLPTAETYTLSCIAQSLQAGADFVLDIIGNPNVDIAGIFVSAPLNVLTRYTATFTLPAGTSNLRIRCFTGSGKASQIADIKLEVGSKATAWTDNVITANNAARVVSIPNLSSLSAFFGNAEIGPNGALRQGQTAYDTGLGFFLGADASGNAVLSMAANNGGKLLCNPAQGIFKLIKPQIEGVDAFTGTITGTLTQTVNNGSQSYGSLTVTPGGSFQAPVTIRWGVDFDSANGTIVNASISGATNGSTASFEGNATNERIFISIYAQLVDSAGRIVIVERGHQATHGTFTAL